MFVHMGGPRNRLDKTLKSEKCTGSFGPSPALPRPYRVSPRPKCSGGDKFFSSENRKNLVGGGYFRGTQRLWGGDNGGGDFLFSGGVDNFCFL